MTDDAWLGVVTALKEQHEFCHEGDLIKENIKVSTKSLERSPAVRGL